MTAREIHPCIERRPADIRRLFDDIAPRYDLLNHLLSFQVDRWWRERAIDALAPRPGGLYLDACSGTGDLARALLARGARTPWRVLASDFSLGMLAAGGRRRAGRGGTPLRVAADTLALPFADAAFDGATIAFGIRNVSDLATACGELARVLKPGGRLVILEFTRVRNPITRPLLDAYRRWVLPAVGNLISRSRNGAYTYLTDSIDGWPEPEPLAGRLAAFGFRDVKWRRLFPGNVAIHAAER